MKKIKNKRLGIDISSPANCVHDHPLDGGRDPATQDADSPLLAELAAP